MASSTEPVGLTRTAVVDAAVEIVEHDGLGALSMRKLATRLGVKPASIYWHVGNREALLDAIGERLATEFEMTSPTGATPRERLLEVARAVRATMTARSRITDLLVRETKGIAMLVGPRNAILREFRAAGLGEDDALTATRAFVLQIAGFVLAERQSGRFVEQLARGRAEVPGLAEGDGVEPLRRFDFDELFEFSIGRFLTALLGPVPAAGADP